MFNFAIGEDRPGFADADVINTTLATFAKTALHVALKIQKQGLFLNTHTHQQGGDEAVHSCRAGDRHSGPLRLQIQVTEEMSDVPGRHTPAVARLLDGKATVEQVAAMPFEQLFLKEHMIHVADTIEQLNRAEALPVGEQAQEQGPQRHQTE